MDPLYLLPVLFFAACDWMAVARRRRSLEYFFKPATLGALIGVAYLSEGGVPDARWKLTLMALTFSLIGDIALMLPRNFFVAGLGAFLVAHVYYILAFQPGPPASASTVLTYLCVGAVSTLVFLRVRRALVEQGRGALVFPVFTYVVAITVMVDSALTAPAYQGYPVGHIAAAGVGACLFYLSDAVIAWHRFVHELSWAPVTIMVTYHLAQIALVYALVG